MYAIVKCNLCASKSSKYIESKSRRVEEFIGFTGVKSLIENWGWEAMGSHGEAKERDYEELLLLSHDAYHAKDGRP